MTDVHPSIRVMQIFETLFQSLSGTWPEKDLKTPRRYVDYGEEEEAIDELIALGLKDRRGFTAEQIELIEELIEIIKMKDLLWVDKLRIYKRDKAGRGA